MVLVSFDSVFRLFVCLCFRQAVKLVNNCVEIHIIAIELAVSLQSTQMVRVYPSSPIRPVNYCTLHMM